VAGMGGDDNTPVRPLAGWLAYKTANGALRQTSPRCSLFEKCRTVSRYTRKRNVMYVTTREVQPFPTSIDTKITTAQYIFFVDIRTEFYPNRMNNAANMCKFHLCPK
jgi:hypothetical protein